MKNDIQNEDVVTSCELVKKYGDNEFVQPMGIVFDRDMKIDDNRVFRGSMSNNLVSKDASGQYAFFIKDIDSGLNNINVAWVDYSIWSRSYGVVSDVATANMLDEETQKLEI